VAWRLEGQETDVVKQLTLTQVAKSYGGIAALTNVHLDARPGEVHVLIGENGAGKSTLIKILAGVERPDSGTVTWGDEVMDLATPIQAVKLGIAAVFQELSLIPDLTVANNVWFRRESLSAVGTIRSGALHARTRQLFDRLGIPEIAPHRLVSDLSVGERQLVEIAKAISTEPQILILDEATSALSLHQTEWLLDTSRRLAAQGVLIFFISHRMGEVRSIADRITVLRNGQSVGTYEIGNVSDDEIVAMMLGRRVGQLYPDKSSVRPGRELLRCEGMTLGHRLQDVSLSISEGEIVGIGGLQGQGQVELLEALAGVVRTEGTIYVQGDRRRFTSPRDAIDAGIGVAFVPEDRKIQGLLLTKSIRVNLTLASLTTISRFGFISRRRERETVRRLLDRLQVNLSSSEQPVGSLSGGNQQKIVIAKYLETHAKVLLLFDLTRGVDVGTKAEIFRLMQELAGQGYAFVFYSTDIEELVHVCHRVVVMSHGRVVSTLQDPQISNEAILAASVGAEEMSVI
jgi:ribose transport system ATP-binding protein